MKYKNLGFFENIFVTLYMKFKMIGVRKVVKKFIANEQKAGRLDENGLVKGDK